MTIEERIQLCKEMPYLIPRDYTGHIVKDYDYSYIEGEWDLPPGWFEMFLQMCRDFKAPLRREDALDTSYFIQLKEKYGEMRVDFSCTTPEIRKIIEKYEHISQFICENCGKPAVYRTQGWIDSYCKSCCAEDLKVVDKIEFYPIIKLILFSPEGSKEIEFDCQDEWNRLYKK